MTAMTVSSRTKTWRLFAQRTRSGGRVGYLNFGRRGWAGRADGEGVFEVELHEDERGDYFGWLAASPDGGDVDNLVHICDDRNVLAHYYSGGNPRYNIDADEMAGLGRVVRLSVDELHAA